MKLPIRHEAIIELDEAVEFYEQQEPGLGLALLDQVEAVVEYASEHPSGGEPHTRDDHAIRRFVVSRFPYLVFTALIDGRREVIAIAHAGRRPDYWHGRLS